MQEELEKIIGKGKTQTFFKRIFGKAQESDDIKELQKYAKSYGIKLKADLTLVRGLAYYTGLVFEIVMKNKGQVALPGKSIAGGGRYGDLIKKLGGKDIPATGISIGLDRICEILRQQTKDMQQTITKILIIPITQENEDYAIKCLQELRQKAINSDISYKKPGKALDYANKQGIPYVVFIGKDEQKKKKVKIRNMKSGKEMFISLRDVKTLP